MSDSPKLNIKIDCEECIGDGACVDAAPDTFDMDDDSKAFVKESFSDTKEDILAAAESCPLDIITVEDAESGESLYP